MSFVPCGEPLTVEMQQTFNGVRHNGKHTFGLKHEQFGYFVGQEVEEFVSFLLGVGDES